MTGKISGAKEHTCFPQQSLLELKAKTFTLISLLAMWNEVTVNRIVHVL
jgi:hypothetical protein